MPLSIVGTGFIDRVKDAISTISGNEPYELTIVEDGKELNHKEELDNSLEMKKIYGTIVELHTLNQGGVRIGLYQKNHGLHFIEADRLILTGNSKAFNASIVSEYEVLWAAGIMIDSMNLKPQIEGNGETNISGIFYIE